MKDEMCGVAQNWVCPFANDHKEDSVTTPEERQACSSKVDTLLLSQEVSNTRELLDIVSKVFFEKDSQKKNESKDSYIDYCRRKTNGMTHNSDEFLAKKNVKRAWDKKLIQEEVKKTFRIIQNNPERVKSAYQLNDISYLNNPVQQNITKAGKNRRKLCRSAPLLRSIFDSGEKYNSGQLEDLCLVPLKNLDTLDVDSIQLDIEDIESYDDDDPYPFARFRNHVHRKGMDPKSDLKNTYIIPTLPKSSFSRNEKEDLETKRQFTPVSQNNSTLNCCKTPFSITRNEIAVDENEKATLEELERSMISKDKEHLLALQLVSSRRFSGEVIEPKYSKIKQDANPILPDTDQGPTNHEVSPKESVIDPNQSLKDVFQLNTSENFPGNSLSSKQKANENSLSPNHNASENLLSPKHNANESSLPHKHKASESSLFAKQNANENSLPTKYKNLINEKPKLDQSFIDEYNRRIGNPTEASTLKKSSKIPTQSSLKRPKTGTRSRIRTKTTAQRVKESQNTLNGSSRKSTPRTRTSTARRKKVNYEEKIRSLDNQNLENQRKLAELQQEEKFLIQTKLKLKEDLDDFSNKESKMKLERSKAKVILNEKLKIMRIEEKRRRKTEADRQREEKKRMQEKIATNKLELEKLPLEKEKEIKELMEKLKKLEDDKKKQEKIAIKREKDLRAKAELEEKQLIEEDEEKEQKLIKQLREEKEHNESLLQSTHQKLKTIQNKKEKQTVFGKQEQERIAQEKEKFLQKEKERMEREAREQEERIQKEKEAQEQAIIDMQTRREQALKRRDFNRDMKKNLAESKRNQAINRPTFSYFQAIPKKTWELPIGWQKRPTYKPGGIRIKR